MIKENRMKWKPLVLTVMIASLCFCASSQKKTEKERAQNPRYQYNVGIFYLNNGQLEEAVTYLKRSLALKPDFDLALDGMGLAFFMQREFEQAISYFKKCLEINPKMTDAHNHLGTVYQEMGLLDEAEASFRNASADLLYHSRELPLYNIARLYFTRQKFQEAMDYVNQALIINRRMVLAMNLKGILYENMGKFSDAVTAYQDALKINPDDITLKYNLAGAYVKNEQYSRAEPLLIEIRPNAVNEEMKTNIAKYLDMIQKRK